MTRDKTNQLNSRAWCIPGQGPWRPFTVRVGARPEQESLLLEINIPYKQNQQGFSLLEMAFVVLILSIIAMIAMPDLSATNSLKLDTAAKEVAASIQFARAEAIRTKIPRGINTDAANDQIRVYSLPGFTPTYDIYHPINKKLYDIQLKTDAFVAGVDLVSANFVFTGGFSSSTNLGFNTEGNPKYTLVIDYMLTSGTITLAYQGQQRIVSIAPMTGRVTIQ